MGQTLSKKGLWEMGVGFFKGIPQPWAQRVVSGDNAHSDNQQGSGQKRPWTLQAGQGLKDSSQDMGRCLKENSSPTGDPLRCQPSTQEVHPGWADTGVLVASGVLGRWEVTAALCMYQEAP